MAHPFYFHCQRHFIHLIQPFIVPSTRRRPHAAHLDTPSICREGGKICQHTPLVQRGNIKAHSYCSRRFACAIFFCEFCKKRVPHLENSSQSRFKICSLSRKEKVRLFTRFLHYFYNIYTHFSVSLEHMKRLKRKREKNQIKSLIFFSIYILHLACAYSVRS